MDDNYKNFLSPFHITSLLKRTKADIRDLSLAEQNLLEYFLERTNLEAIPIVGYHSWPSTNDIMLMTGQGESTIARLRKTLMSKGYINVVVGRGPGSSNKYYVNAQMIVDNAVKSGCKKPDKPVAKTNINLPVNKPHERNTQGLKHRELKEDKPAYYVPYVIPKKEVETNFYNEDDDAPYWAR